MDRDIENLANVAVNLILKDSKYKYFLTNEEYEKHYATFAWIMIYRNKLENRIKQMQKEIDNLKKNCK